MKKWGLVFIMLIFSVLITGCGLYENPDKGDCTCNFYISDIPDEFVKEIEEGNDEIEVSVLFKNITNKKQYKVKLNNNNNFKYTAYLEPGLYAVEECYFSSRNIKDIQVKPSIDRVEITKESEGNVNLIVDGDGNIASKVQRIEPIAEMYGYDKFSNTVQIKDQIIPITEILNYIKFESDKSVRSLEELELRNNDYNVVVTVINVTENTLPWNQCKVKSVKFYGSNVVMNGGLNVNMSVKDVVNADKGLYGKPDKLDGSIFWTSGLLETKMIYINDVNGNKITITAVVEDHINSVEYEFTQV